jgi:DNA-binding Lrp family transcriptional regulator
MEYSYVKKALLRELSEDSRSSVTRLAKRLKISRNTVISNIKWLEKELGMSYTLEFDMPKMGLANPQISFFKFGTKPTTGEVRNAFEGGKDFITFLATLEGDSDAVLQTVSDSSSEYMYWAVGIYLKLAKFKPTIQSSIVRGSIIGFMPLPTDLLRKLDLGKVALDPLDRKILALLNDDSRMTYKDIADELGEEVTTIRYRIRRIDRSGIIRKYTLILKRPPPRYNIIYNYKEDLSAKAIEAYKRTLNHYLETDGHLSLTNSFVYVASAVGTSDIVGIGSFGDFATANEKVVDAHLEIHDGSEVDIHYSRILDVIYGNIPFRNSDTEKALRQSKGSIAPLKI